MTRAIRNLALDLTPPVRKALSEQGFNLPGLAGTASLRAGSRIEGPVSLIASVPTASFLDLGAFCNISAGTLGNVRIGRYCSIAEGVTLGAHAHPTDWLTTSRTAYHPALRGWDRLLLGDGADTLPARKPRFSHSAPITEIGSDVWLGQGVFIKAGVRIGDGAVVGARSVVTSDVPPYAIVAGTPARKIRMRFDEALVARLLAFAWWRYSIYDLFDAPLDEPARALDVLADLEAAGKITPYVGPQLEDLLATPPV